ncbi:MAG: nucleotide exchange factor GrpE [Candidatus Fermentibacteria bacterium]|nr:nucleotide exchange factor GrpE [Candidatus Fermentibacteria bacterium]
MGDPRRSRKAEKEGRRGTKPPPSLHEEKPENSELPGEEAELDVQDDKMVSLEKERDDLMDKLQRLAAEFDNYRKRQARDFNRLIDQGRKKLVEELLTVLDNFDRAKVTCQGEHSDKEIVDGILQTSEQLHSVLKKEGLEEILIKPGDPFDPNIHEAMVAESIDEGETDVVLEVFQKGYYFGLNLLRPARVKVGKVSPGDRAGAS